MDIFLRIYCMDLPELTLLTAAAAAVFLWLRGKFGNNRWWKVSVAIALLMSLGAVLYSTVLSRSPGEGGQVLLQPLHSYREILRGGSRELLRSNFMNALLFFPAGLLGVSALPAKWPGWCRALAVFALLMGLSVGVEAIQYACSLGNVEADDVLHNALGAALGCLTGLLSFEKRK